jgi:peroxiredoxin
MAESINSRRWLLVDMDRSIDFELPDHEGKPWRLAAHLARGPVLLVFYRGDW